MSALRNAILAEHLKSRGTFLRKCPVLAAVLSGFPPFLLFALSSEPLSRPVCQSYAFVVLNGWVFFVLPMFTLLLVLQLYSPEHTQGMWKHLNSLPTNRSLQAFAKHAMGAWHLLLGHVLLLGMILLALIILNSLRPELEIDPVYRLGPLWKVLDMLTRCYLASLAPMSIMLMLASRMKGTGPVLFVGILGFLVGAAGARLVTSPFIPWSMPLVWLMSFHLPDLPWQPWWILPWMFTLTMVMVVHWILARRKPLF